MVDVTAFDSRVEQGIWFVTTTRVAFFICAAVSVANTPIRLHVMQRNERQRIGSNYGFYT